MSKVLNHMEEQDIIDKIKRIKRSRLKPEELYFIDIFENMKRVPGQQRNGIYKIFWKKDSVIVFEQEIFTKKLRCHTLVIWAFLLKCDYDFIESKSFIEKMVHKYMNWEGYYATPPMD